MNKKKFHLLSEVTDSAGSINHSILLHACMLNEGVPSSIYERKQLGDTKKPLKECFDPKIMRTIKTVLKATHKIFFLFAWFNSSTDLLSTTPIIAEELELELSFLLKDK